MKSNVRLARNPTLCSCKEWQLEGRLGRSGGTLLRSDSKRSDRVRRTTVGANLTIGKKVIASPEVHLTVLENIAA